MIRRFNGISANIRGDDERFGVVNGERFERFVGTLNDGFFTFDQIEDVDGASSIVGHSFCEPMSSRFDEFQRVQAGLFFAPAFAAAEGFHAID